MCGIAGIYRRDGHIQPSDVDAVRSMLIAEQHRGPDADGLYTNSRVALGHRRLAILDLSDVGRQPMSNEEGNVWIVFNGEIYNYLELRQDLLSRGHIFQSNSDTEVLIHGFEEWGIGGLLPRLVGMFAFALYDERAAGEGRFYLVRDRLGIKPLYYVQTDESISFASEVKALRTAGRCSTEVDRDALVGFLSFGSVPFPRTYLKQVACLPPGHYLSVDPRRTELTEYWNISYSSGGQLDTLPELLEDCVARHLLSDVPIGIFLSGGVDSAGIVAEARARVKQRLQTLTISFDEQEFSEAGDARAFAEHFSTDHHDCRVTRREFIDSVPEFLRAVDQPSSDGVNTYFVSKVAAQQGLKVVLSGLGGDEVYFGYDHYRHVIRHDTMWRGWLNLPAPLRALMQKGPAAYGSMTGQERWGRFGYFSDFPADQALYLLFRGFFPLRQVCTLLDADESEVRSRLRNCFVAHVAKDDGQYSNALNYLEYKRYMHDQLLRDSDVFSMAHSIELRVPYLDHRLVEHAASISPSIKVRGDMNKPVLVNAIGDTMVTQAAARRKRGFTFPFAVWMRDRADDLEELAVGGHVVNSQAARSLWSQFRAGRLHWSRAWSLAVLESAVGN